MAIGIAERNAKNFDVMSYRLIFERCANGSVVSMKALSKESLQDFHVCGMTVRCYTLPDHPQSSSSLSEDLHSLASSRTVLPASLSLCLALLAGCGGSSSGASSSGGSSSGGSSTTPPTTPSYIYVTAQDATGAPFILTYPINPAGTSVAAVSKAAGLPGTIFQQIRSDGQGHIYALSTPATTSVTTTTVTEYSTSGGVLTETRSFNFTTHEETQALALTIDQAGNTYVFQDGTGTIYKFASSASCSATPSATLAADTRVLDAMAVDASGNLYCREAGRLSLRSTRQAPRTVCRRRRSPWGNYLNQSETDLVIDAAGNLYVSGTTFPANVPNSGTAALLEFDAGDTGAPTRMITGGATLLKQPNSIAVTTSGTLYVYDSFARYAILGFDVASQGNISPTSAFSGSDVNQQVSVSIAID